MKNRFMAGRVAVAVMLAGVLGGCVSAQKYNALQAEEQIKEKSLQDTKSKIDDLTAQLSGKDKELADGKSKEQTLSSLLSDANDKSKSLQGAVEDLKRANDRLASELAKSVEFLTSLKVSIDKRLDEAARAAAKPKPENSERAPAKPESHDKAAGAPAQSAPSKVTAPQAPKVQPTPQ